MLNLTDKSESTGLIVLFVFFCVDSTSNVLFNLMTSTLNTGTPTPEKCSSCDPSERNQSAAVFIRMPTHLDPVSPVFTVNRVSS